MDVFLIQNVKFRFSISHSEVSHLSDDLYHGRPSGLLIRVSVALGEPRLDLLKRPAQVSRVVIHCMVAAEGKWWIECGFPGSLDFSSD